MPRMVCARVLATELMRGLLHCQIRFTHSIASKLPKELLASLAKEFEPTAVDKILDGFEKARKRPVTFRVNTFKCPNIRHVIDDLQRTLNTKIDRVPWLASAFTFRSTDLTEKQLEKHKMFTSGSIYLQSLSSMIPPLVLNPSPGTHTLDLCAAPGSKCTQMAVMMLQPHGTDTSQVSNGLLLANEENGIRAERLLFNIRRQLMTDQTKDTQSPTRSNPLLDLPVVQSHKCTLRIQLHLGDGRKLLDRMPDLRTSFDYVLVDAPCSGIGRIRPDDLSTFHGNRIFHGTRRGAKIGETASNFFDEAIERLASVQRILLSIGAQALKPGGRLVYATCTLLKRENEHVVDWIVKEFAEKRKTFRDNKFGELDFEEIFSRRDESGQCLSGMLPCMLPGAEMIRKQKGMVTILPSTLFEGFFVAKLRRK